MEDRYEENEFERITLNYSEFGFIRLNKLNLNVVTPMLVEFNKK